MLGCKASSDFTCFALEKGRDGEGFQVGDNRIKILKVFSVRSLRAMERGCQERRRALHLPEGLPLLPFPAATAPARCVGLSG